MQPSRNSQYKQHEASNNSIHNMYNYENESPTPHTIDDPAIRSRGPPTSNHTIRPPASHSNHSNHSHHSNNHNAYHNQVVNQVKQRPVVSSERTGYSQSSHSHRSHSNSHGNTRNLHSSRQPMASGMSAMGRSQSDGHYYHKNTSIHSSNGPPPNGLNGSSSSTKNSSVHPSHLHSKSMSHSHINSMAPPPSFELTSKTLENDPNLFNLQGILKIMRRQDQNYQLVTLGMDLTQLGGVDLNRPQPNLYRTFSTPWVEKWDDSGTFVTPSCYTFKRTNEHSATKYMARYKDATLFYIFYCIVGDKVQVVAARELYQRKWVYHKRLQVWLHQMSEERVKECKEEIDACKDKLSTNVNEENAFEKSALGSNLNKKLDPDDKSALFVRETKGEEIEYFDVESWKTKHYLTKFPVDWVADTHHLMTEWELTFYCKSFQSDRESFL